MYILELRERYYLFLYVQISEFVNYIRYNISNIYHPVSLPDGHPPVYTVPPLVDVPLDAVDEHVIEKRDKSQPVEN